MTPDKTYFLPHRVDCWISNPHDSFTHVRYAGWHVGQQQWYPTSVSSGPASERTPGVMEALELRFYSSMSGVLGSFSFLLPLWCPV